LHTEAPRDAADFRIVMIAQTKNALHNRCDESDMNLR
jgi:hypothetical protein